MASASPFFHRVSMPLNEKTKKTRRTIYFIDNQYFVFLVLLVFKIS